MEVFQKNVYLLSKEESKTLTLSEIAELRKGKQYQSRVKFFQDMKDEDVRNLLENKFSPILSNKRFSCATRDGQTSARLNFHGEHRVWDGRTIKRKVQGGSALYLVLEDEPVFNSVSPARGTPSSLQGHLSSTSFYHNSKNGQTVSWTQTPQSATTVTSLKTTNSTENAVETTQWERDMNTNNPGWLGDNLNAPNSPDIHLESLEAALTVETKSGTSMLTKRNQEQNEIPSTATDALQSDDSALSSSGETVSQNGIFSAQETTQEDRVTKPIRLMEKDCLISDKSDSSGQSDSGIPSEASACPAQALNRPISLRIQDARMKPAEGPLQGGGLFRAVIDEELPRSMETGWATFGDKSVKVWVSRDGLSLFGEEIPRGDVPGPVTVTFSSLNGECVAKATYTYQERKNSTTLQIKRALDEIEECVKRLRSEPDLCDESEELAKENFRESGGDAPGPVTVTFATLNGECVAKTTSTYKKCENPMTWQITHFKRALDGVEECVKRLRSMADSCYESNKFAEENRHDSGVTQVAKAQLGEEGYFGDTEKSDTESEDSYRMDNNENEIEEGFSSNKCSWKLQMTEKNMNKRLLSQLIGNNWRDLARQLKFTEAVIDSIESDKGASTNECCIAVIVRWINQQGDDATVEKFGKVLITTGLKSVAEKLPDLLSSEENDELGRNDSNQMESTIDEIEENCKQLREEELEKEKNMAKKLQDSLEESQKLRTRIQELEEELSRVKQKLYETSQEGQEWKTRSLKLEKELAGIREDKSELDLVENFDNSVRGDDSEDTGNSLTLDRGDTEREIDVKLKDLDELLRKNVTFILQVPEEKEDKLKVPVQLDLLSKLSFSLQELYTSVLSIGAECCKCSEEVRREFYDFAYHGLRAEHNDVVHRVEDLEMAQGKMTAEEKKDFGKLQQLQTNRQRQVDRLEKLWRGLFSSPESRPECTHSDPCGATGKTCHSKKDLRRRCTDPGAKPKQIRLGEQKTSPETTTTESEDEKYEVCFKKSMKTTTLFKKREIEEKTCHLMSFSARKHRDS